MNQDSAIQAILSEYLQYLPRDSGTRAAILRDEDWGEIAMFAKGEGFEQLALILEQGEQYHWEQSFPDPH